MTIVNLSKKNIDAMKDLGDMFDLTKLKLGKFDSILMKVTTKEKSSKILWGEIFKFTKRWVVNTHLITEIMNSFDEKTLNLTKVIDDDVLSKAFTLSK